MNIFISLLALLLVDYKQLDCLVEAVYYEAGNQSIAGKAMVAQVIRNRVEDPRWADSYCGVVRERGQFSYYWDGKPEPRPKVDNELEWMALVESEWVSLYAMVTPFKDADGKLYYHNDKIEPPKWAKRVTHVIDVDNHIFYTD